MIIYIIHPILKAIRKVYSDLRIASEKGFKTSGKCNTMEFTRDIAL